MGRFYFVKLALIAVAAFSLSDAKATGLKNFEKYLKARICVSRESADSLIKTYGYCLYRTQITGTDSAGRPRYAFRQINDWDLVARNQHGLLFQTKQGGFLSQLYSDLQSDDSDRPTLFGYFDRQLSYLQGNAMRSQGTTALSIYEPSNNEGTGSNMAPEAALNLSLVQRILQVVQVVAKEDRFDTTARQKIITKYLETARKLVRALSIEASKGGVGLHTPQITCVVDRKDYPCYTFYSRGAAAGGVLRAPLNYQIFTIKEMMSLYDAYSQLKKSPIPGLSGWPSVEIEQSTLSRNVAMATMHLANSGRYTRGQPSDPKGWDAHMINASDSGGPDLDWVAYERDLATGSLAIKRGEAAWTQCHYAYESLNFIADVFNRMKGFQSSIESTYRSAAAKSIDRLSDVDGPVYKVFMAVTNSNLVKYSSYCPTTHGSSSISRNRDYHLNETTVKNGVETKGALEILNGTFGTHQKNLNWGG